MANPLLTGVEVKYPENAILDLTQNTYPHYYDGSEIVVAGRLVDEDMNYFKANVAGHGVSWAGAGCGLGMGAAPVEPVPSGRWSSSGSPWTRATRLQASTPQASPFLLPWPRPSMT